MSSKRSRRVLLAAFAVSLLLHLIAARFLHLVTPSPEQAERVTVSHRTPLRITKAAAPVPREARSPVPAMRRPAPSPIAVRHTGKPSRVIARDGIGKHGRVYPRTVTASRPLPPATPAVAKTAAPECPKPDAEAGLLSAPPPPELSTAARADAIAGVAVVTVRVDALGRVADARLAQSSGSGNLDVVAVQMARSAGYSPKYISCKAVAGDFAFSVKFFPW